MVGLRRLIQEATVRHASATTHSSGVGAGSPTPWPVTPRYKPVLTPEERDQAARHATRLRKGEPGLGLLVGFGDGVESGWAPGPTVYLEDHHGIELSSATTTRAFAYRSLGLAGDGDFYLLSRPRVPAFEAYLRDIVGLGRPTVLEVQCRDDRAAQRLAYTAYRDTEVMAPIVRAARSAGGLNVLPYHATGDAWLLAAAIAEAAAVPVRVAGPTPRIARRTNDKLWFASTVRSLLGEGALPPTYSAYGPAAAAALVSRLAHESENVVVKLPSSAGSMGNLTLSASTIRSMPTITLRSVLLSSLHRLGWSERYPILIGVWQQSVIASPSVQIWLPATPDGPPIIEDIFVQTLDVRDEFVGAATSRLPEDVNGRLNRQALLIATLFQELGYFGRLSLDAVLVGTRIEHSEIRWIECNGRWGGVSIPLTVAGRLGLSGPGQTLVIVQRILHETPQIEFDTALTLLDEHLFRPGLTQEGLVLLQPIGHDEHGLTFFSGAADNARAIDMARAALDVLCPRRPR